MAELAKTFDVVVIGAGPGGYTGAHDLHPDFVTIGKTIGQRAIEKGIKAVVFDRGGYRYLVSEKGKNRVASLADAAREAGLKF